ncbi:MAG: HAD family phosphatase [Candidatus Planktophila sp.]|nr:HAD family phosphatase [Candidatus Planktophila sp.]
MSLPSPFFDAVFFDMDGLMVDSEPLWFLSEIEVTKPFGYSWLESDQIACLGGPLSRVGQYMFEKCGGKESPEFFTQTLIKVQAEKMRGNTPTMPGAVELVRDLQANGVKTGLVSASPRLIVDAVLDSLSHDLFPFSISSDDVSETKPAPDCYLTAARISDSNIANSLIFEDSLTGMKAAISSGAYLIAVPHLVHIDESEKVRVVNSLAQLDFEKLQNLHADFSAAI